MTWHGTAGTTRRALGAALLSGTLAVGAVGCGSSDDDAATTAASAPTAAATATATAPPQTTATATDVTPGDGGATPADKGATPDGEDAPATPPATTAGSTPPPASTTRTTPRTTTTTAPPPATPTRNAGSAADQAAVRRTVDRYMQAFVAGDGATVCGLLDDRQRRLLGSRGAGSCEEATATAQKAIAKDATIRKALEELRVDKVSVRGDRAVAAATVATNGRDGSFPITLSRTSGGWRISSNSVAGG